MGKMKLTRNREIVALRLSGHSLEEIGRRFGITRQRVSEIMAGITKVTTTMSRLDRVVLDVVAERADHGQFTNERVIHRRLGFLHPETVHQAVVRLRQRDLLQDMGLDRLRPTIKFLLQREGFAA